jgi:2-hydroxy-3-oxopropionate reductase
MLLAQAGGADPAAMRTAIRGGFAESRILEVHGQRMLDRNFVPGGQVKTQLKDLENILHAAESASIRLPVTALVADPPLLVADEPTGDLDRENADQILGLLQSLSTDHGKTIVMVTHDAKAADAAARVLHLEKGRLVENIPLTMA